MVLSTKACYAVYVDAMYEIRQKTTKNTHTAQRRIFSQMWPIRRGYKFHWFRELIFYLCSLVFSTNINVLWLRYIMSSSPLLLLIPCRFRLAPVLTTQRQLVTIEKPWHQFQSLSILLVRFLLTCNSTIQWLVSVNDNFSHLNEYLLWLEPVLHLVKSLSK